MSPPSDEQLARLSPEGMRAYVVRCVRRACWEFISFDDCTLEGDYRRDAFIGVVHDLEMALDATDDEIGAACLRAGTLALPLRAEQRVGWGPNGCYAAILEHTRASLDKVDDVRSIQRALLELAEYPNSDSTKFKSRPSLTIRIKAIRRDYDIAVEIRAGTPSAYAMFGDLWTDDEFPEYADYDESW